MPKAYQVTIEFQKYDKNRLTETFSDKMRSILRAHTFKTQKQTLQLPMSIHLSIIHQSVINSPSFSESIIQSLSPSSSPPTSPPSLPTHHHTSKTFLLVLWWPGYHQNFQNWSIWSQKNKTNKWELLQSQAKIEGEEYNGLRSLELCRALELLSFGTGDLGIQKFILKVFLKVQE